MRYLPHPHSTLPGGAPTHTITTGGAAMGIAPVMLQVGNTLTFSRTYPRSRGLMGSSALRRTRKRGQSCFFCKRFVIGAVAYHHRPQSDGTR
jgi:hypothetical protein